jgi:uncharacterized protein (TIGR02246 family)
MEREWALMTAPLDHVVAFVFEHARVRAGFAQFVRSSRRRLHRTHWVMTDSTKARTAAEATAAALTTAWNAGDGKAFAAEFAGDADFVNIFAMHVVGRDEIAQLHQTIFDTIYKGSRNTFTVEEVRSLGEHAAVVHIRAHLHVPSGPLAGEIVTLATAVLTREGHDWRLVVPEHARADAAGADRRLRIARRSPLECHDRSLSADALSPRNGDCGPRAQ